MLLIAGEMHFAIRRYALNASVGLTTTSAVENALGDPLFLIAGGSGIVRLTAMLRYPRTHRQHRAGASVVFVTQPRRCDQSREVGLARGTHRWPRRHAYGDAPATARMARLRAEPDQTERFGRQANAPTT
jgi:ferredoxin-NADP reductase